MAQRPPSPTGLPDANGGIVLRDLRKSFGDHRVLDGVDLGIGRGEARVILGRSGQGKSVMLKLIVGLLDPDGGTIEVDGVSVPDLNRKEIYALRKRFSMVFQGGALFDSLSVAENVGLGLREHTQLSQAEIHEKALRSLGMVGLPNAAEKMPAELSGGMRKRASLARAIVTEPDYILYDEPTTGLDPITADAINRLINRLDDELGVTSVVVTHDMASAFMVGDRFALLNEGKIVFEGDVQEAREVAQGPMRQFIDGSSEGPLDSF